MLADTGRGRATEPYATWWQNKNICYWIIMPCEYVKFNDLVFLFLFLLFQLQFYIVSKHLEYGTHICFCSSMQFCVLEIASNVLFAAPYGHFNGALQNHLCLSLFIFKWNRKCSLLFTQIQGCFCHTVSLIARQTSVLRPVTIQR